MTQYEVPDYGRSITISSVFDKSTDIDESAWQINTPTNYRFLMDIPERKAGSRINEWLVGATDTTIAVIESHVNRANIKFADEHAAFRWSRLSLLNESYCRIREYIAEYKANKTVPDRCNDMILDPRTAGYQRVGALCASMVDGFAEFMEQGTGKTLTAISAIAQLEANSKVLIVCPKQLRINWLNELREFCPVDHKATVIWGGQMLRISHLVDINRAARTHHLSVGILSYDSIQGMWDALKMMQWDVAICDESHLFKSPFTKRWKYIERLRDTAKKRIALTGTPIANSINDLWTQLEWLGKGYSGFSSFGAFKKFFGVYDKSNETKYERFLGLQNVPVIKDRLSRFSFSLRKKEAMPDLPDKVYDIITVDMTPEQAKAYDSLRTSLAVEIQQTVDNTTLEHSLVINNILTMLLRLAQVTSGYLKFPAERDQDGTIVMPELISHFEPNPKIEALMEVLREKSPTEKTLVWAHFTFDILKIKKACDVEGIKAVTFTGATSDVARVEAERAFNNDIDCKVFIGNPGAGGTGLNLLGYPPGQPDASDCNADHVIYYSQDWSSLKRAQSEDRNHRRGTRTQVRVSDLTVPDTIDQHIRERVTQKRLSALEISDVKSILEAVLHYKAGN